jgi:TlyA family rRNA methyltransferase/putative hemolysin
MEDVDQAFTVTLSERQNIVILAIHGYFTLETSAPIQAFEGRLDLWNAEFTGLITTAQGTVKLKALVHSQRMVMIFDLETSGSERSCRFVWHPEEAVPPVRAHALREFAIDVRGLACIDVGASTGGFTDCLLQHGAEQVYALDVGYGQLDYKLRQDSRVVVMEKVNAHYPFNLPGKVSLAVMDVSFISVSMVIPNVLPHLAQKGELLVLFKPQFEAERENVGKGGVIRDPAVHAGTISCFITWMNSNRLSLLNLAASPILGAEGNREFLIQVRPWKP